jgi:3-isopropylmalate dehydrogenase
MVQGGMGVAASGNINPGKTSLFEPIHGSAPKHAGKNVACPVAAIMAGAMMLDYIGEKDAAVSIEGAIQALIQSGEIKGLGTGVHGTDEVGDMVVNRLSAAEASL